MIVDKNLILLGTAQSIYLIYKQRLMRKISAPAVGEYTAAVLLNT